MKHLSALLLALFLCLSAACGAADSPFGLNLSMPFPAVSAEPDREPQLFTVGVDGVPYTGWLVSFALKDNAAAWEMEATLDRDLVQTFGAQRRLTADFSLFTWDDGRFCLIQRSGNRLSLLLQDGRYTDFDTSYAFSGSISLPALDAFFPSSASLGVLAVRCGDWLLRGPAVQYRADSQEDGMRRIESYSDALEKAILSDRAVRSDGDALDGMSYIFIFYEDQPVVALMLPDDDSAGDSLTAIYNPYMDFRFDFPAQPTAAPAAPTPAPVAAPVAVQAAESVYLDGRAITPYSSTLYVTREDTIGDVYALTFIAVDGEDVYAAVVMLSPQDYRAGAAFSASDLMGIDTTPGFVLDVLRGGQESAWILGDAPDRFQQVDFEVLSASPHLCALSLVFDAEDNTRHTLQGTFLPQVQTADIPQQAEQADPLAGTGICAMCSGSGKCHLCGGKGETYTYNSSVGSNGWLTCSACYGRGDCPWCSGTGYGGLYAQ